MQVVIAMVAGCDNKVPGLFINRLIISTTSSEILSSDGCENNCRRTTTLNEQIVSICLYTYSLYCAVTMVVGKADSE